MRLDDLLAAVAGRPGLEHLVLNGGTGGDLSGAADVAAVTHDSRAVAPGALFCCVRGAHADGHDHAPAAAAAGAVALLCERPLGLDLPELRVPSVRAAMGPVAAAFHGEPSARLAVVGITGTNGKTTTAHLLAAILDAAGRPCGVIGTLTGARTTPEAPELQAQLAAFLAEGRQAVSMEVSSHALDQHRVDGTAFALAVFTNLSQDHLDHHGTMEAYFQAKARLFDAGLSARAVVNLDDPHGRLLRDAAQIPTTGFSLADATAVEAGPRGSRFRWRGTELRTTLAGRFNLANVLAAVTAAAELGVGTDAIAQGLAEAAPVPGRFELVDAGQPFAVVVDYAHTADGLAALLASARELTGPGGRVLVVFGCGGDRDRAKRPAMGAAAAEGADVVVVTSDNPRSEDPHAIIASVLSGIPEDVQPVIEPDRRAAITAAVSRASAGDVVVIAGKGHETTQIAGATCTPFDDRVVAREVLVG